MLTELASEPCNSEVVEPIPQLLDRGIERPFACLTMGEILARLDRALRPLEAATRREGERLSHE